MSKISGINLLIEVKISLHRTLRGDRGMTPLSEQGANIYKLLRDEPSSHKKQQWTITNYVLLIYAAILAKEDVLNAQKPLLIFRYKYYVVLESQLYLYFTAIFIDQDAE
jgi:hypothetical protein